MVASNAWESFRDRVWATMRHIQHDGGTLSGYEVRVNVADWAACLASCPYSWADSRTATIGLPGEIFGIPVVPTREVTPGRIVFRREVEA